MAKVVYNADYGGFSLSRAATERLAAMGVEAARAHLNDPDAAGYDFTGHGLARHDPCLVRVVKEMGSAANGQCAELCVEDLGDGPRAYRIEEYDGKERVEYVDAVVACEDPTPAILRYLRAERAKQDKSIPEDGRDRCSTRTALLETLIASIERGDHLAG